MTEKRFTSFLEDDGYWIRDESNCKIIATGLKFGVSENLTAKLNKLNNENKFLIKQLNIYRDASKVDARENKELLEDIDELHEENKELKENVSELIHEAIVEILDGQRYEGERILNEALRLLE